MGCGDQNVPPPNAPSWGRTTELKVIQKKQEEERSALTPSAERGA